MRKLLTVLSLLAASLTGWSQTQINGVQPSAVNGVTVSSGSAFNGLSLTAPGGLGTITLDGSAHCTATSSAATSVQCTLTGVTAGDLVTFEREDNASGAGLGALVSDPSNGPYTNVYYGNDSADPEWSGISYFANSASGNLVVKMTSTSTDNASISAQAWKGAATTGVLDTGAITQFLASLTGTATNPNCGTAQTPSGNNELIIGYTNTDNTTATAGSGFTAIDAQTAGNPALPEYKIQTTATSTNAPFTDATGDDWLAGCAAFNPSGRSSSLIPLNGVYADFNGNTNGSTVSAANLATGSGASLLGGWGGTYSGATYNTTIAPPNRVSPVWVSTKTYAGTTGIAIDHVSNASESFNWDSTVPAVSAPESLSFFFRTAYTRNTDTDLCDIAQVAHGGSGDNVTMQTGYTTAGGLGLRLEISNGTTYTSPFVAISPNQWYWVSIQLSVSGTHKLYVYSETTPGTLPWTLLGTSTNPVEISGTGNVIFQLGNQGSCDSSGSHVYFAYPQFDAWGQAGFPVLP